MSSKIVTFDFDGTLDRKEVQDYAYSLIKKGVDVWVLTSRYDELHKHLYPHNPTLEDLYKVTDKLKIPRWKIRFTCMIDKSEWLFNTNVLWHLDDDFVEINNINRETKTKGVSVISSNWKTECNKLLK